MTDALSALLAEIEAFGQTNDEQVADHAAKMLNITRDTGQFLAALVRLQRPTRILEVGTSNGYSTVWLADAARACRCLVETIEHDTENGMSLWDAVIQDVIAWLPVRPSLG